MCGIFGFTRLGMRDNKVNAVLAHMSELLVHRGPDGEGSYVDERIALGHRRLSIIDLESGAQPMQDWRKRYTITFNGEIYNFLQLRERFLKEGFRFQTRSDTEVILAAYEKYGEHCVEHFQGMFAFALWDKLANKLFLARDRVGKKPLYYFHDRDRFVFASEIKAILVMENIPREIDMEALNFYLTYGYIPAPMTIFKHIRKIHEASVLSYHDKDVVEKAYWKLPDPANIEDQSEEEYLAQLDSILADAVSSRMISDVPLGAFLSGGIDSSAVVSMMARSGKSFISTFTIDFAEKTFSELEDAKKVAAHCRTQHQVLEVKTDAVNVLPKLAWHFDEPFADSSAIPTYYVSKMAREHVTVILSGDGGDELFAGYNSYQKRDEHSALLRLPAMMRRLVFGGIAGLLPMQAPMRNLLKYAAFASPEDGPDAFGLYPYIKDDVLTLNFRKTAMQFNAVDIRRNIRTKYQAADKLTKLQMIDLQLYLPGDILIKVDRMSMANSLETRAPLLDYRLIEFATRLPVRMKMRDGVSKYLLKKLLQQSVPNDILKKRKQGFAVPVNKWFRTDLNEYTKQILLDHRSRERGIVETKAAEKVLDHHAKGKRDYSEWIYLLLKLELWFQTFMDESKRRI